MCVLTGDFNEVQDASERLNSEFLASSAEVFNAFISEAELCEYQMGGGNFTYVSDRADKFKKIDRFLVCKEFMSTWPLASLSVLVKGFSDHKPLFLSMIPTNFRHIPFRFFNSWSEMPGFTEFVENQSGRFRFNGPANLALATKLRWLKKRIKKWLELKRRELNREYDNKKRKVVELEIIAEQRPLLPHEMEERSDCLISIKEADYVKQKDIRQKYRVRWAMEGDEYSKFFHSILNANMAYNRMHGLKIQVAIRPSFVGHEMMSLNVEEASGLIAPFTLLEIKKRGLGLCWGSLSRQFSFGVLASFIALIPKVKDPSSLGDFRPISLIGCINKIISKVLVCRLKKVIGKLVSVEQTAFLAKRSILYGPLILNEIVAWLKKANKRGMIFKVDIEKAYDSLNWGFLDSVLEQMNFPVKWRGWISAILSGGRTSVLVNGSPTPEFKCSRGLRQGDPLSPFLFVLAMQALTCIMKRAISVGLFKGLRCGLEGLNLTHFLYADDVVFVGKWEKENELNLRQILRFFFLVSGLKINLAKSWIYATRVGVSERSGMAIILGCKTGSFPF
ncbi:uncharacterized protein LOC143633313 [Bidens hawaiensis]|uniref:uncharacterized protein LOC143633313 n=1 Tax=Bidens hawaiensis TaxID=980011 RepID=UPI0040494121